MSAPIQSVLFLCTGNSARSILAEALLRHWGQGRFLAFSAGSHPKGEVHPLALEVLRSRQLPTEGLRSKGWDEFAVPEAPRLDFVFTVCDSAAAEVCPVWPGQPVTAHWGLPDPAAVTGDHAQRLRAFRHTCLWLESRIKLFVALPTRQLQRLQMTQRLREIGLSAPPDDGR